MSDVVIEHQVTRPHNSAVRTFIHDAAAPLTAIRGYAELLEETGERDPAMLSRLITATDHLTAMVTSLGQEIDPSTQIAPLETTLTDVVRIIRQACDVVSPNEDTQRLQYAGAIRCSAVVHPQGLRRALINIIDNAVKYSDGDVVVTLHKTHDVVSMKITDTGRGIAPDDLPKIFKAFERGRLADAQDGGTGLGLASAKTLLERQNGSLSVESTLGVGTVFTVQVPARL